MAAKEGLEVVVMELADGEKEFRIRRDRHTGGTKGTVRTVRELRAWLDGFTAARELHCIKDPLPPVPPH